MPGDATCQRGLASIESCTSAACDMFVPVITPFCPLLVFVCIAFFTSMAAIGLLIRGNLCLLSAYGAGLALRLSSVFIMLWPLAEQNVAESVGGMGLMRP